METAIVGFTEIQEVSGLLDITAITECPYCENLIDLFEIETLTESGYLHSRLLGEDHLGAEHFDEEIECEICGNVFIVSSVTL